MPAISGARIIWRSAAPPLGYSGASLSTAVPVIVRLCDWGIQQIGRTIARLKQQGFTILLVEQNFRFASTVADRFYVMEHGRVIDAFANADLAANMDKLHDYLGV